MASKLIKQMIVENCKDCPYIYWEEDDDPMGGNGWARCNKLRRQISNKYFYEGIAPECPLSDTPKQREKFAKTFGK